MKYNWRDFFSPQVFLLGVSFALLIAISTATVILVNRASNDARLLAETLDIQNKLSDILLSVRRAESSQRGYLFTNDAAYLDDYRAAEPEARKIFAELQVQTKASPARQSLLARIGPLLDQKFAEMSLTIDFNKADRRDDARKDVIGGTGREVMNTLRAITEDAIADEARLAAARSDNSRTTNTLLLIVTLAGAGLIIFIGTISISLVQRSARKAEIARQELEGTNNNLERIVQYRTADLTEANNEIQRFAYIVSHDLRSPLVNIMGFTSELEALRTEIFDQVAKLTAEVTALNGQAAAADGKVEQLSADFDEAIRFIKSSIGNMDRLINAVLKLSREGRRQFHPQAIDMRALLGQIGQTVSHRAAELGARLDIDELPPVESDPLALEQIFANLIDNALKYRRTDVPLQIQVRGRVNAGKAIYDVEDNGRGIDAGDHQRVFELFRRSGKQDRPGEGIGLAHVRALVRRLGGSMELKSELGQGSTFTVILPVQWSVNARNAA
jgi:signal transduction histidine kinase